MPSPHGTPCKKPRVCYTFGVSERRAGKEGTEMEAAAGLVLEGGGMRGVYTAGVLDFFLDQNLYFQKGIGVSAGACHGCSYFCRQRGRAYRVSVDYLEDKNYCSIYSLVKTGDFFGAEMVYHTIPEQYDRLENQVFLESGADFYAVVTDCRTGLPVYHRMRDMYGDMEYIRASASLPLLSRMVEIQGELFLDGGIADSIPLRAFEGMGIEKNVVILTQPRDYRKKPNRLYSLMKLKYRKYPGLLRAVKNRHRVYNETLEHIARQEKEGKVFVIAPESGLGLGRLEKSKEKLQEAYNRGYRDAEKAFGDLKQFLNR